MNHFILQSRYTFYDTVHNLENQIDLCELSTHPLEV